MGETGKIGVDAPHALLLFISADKDEIIPAVLCEKNAKAYHGKASRVGYREFKNSSHFICGGLRGKRLPFISRNGSQRIPQRLAVSPGSERAEQKGFGIVNIDPFDLDRFLDAQAGVYDQVLTELAAGMKRSHWMWFIFPQIKGLGSSAMAHRYGLGSLQEACAYMAHEILGARLEQCTELAMRSHAPTLHGLFGSPDDLKFRSSMTLFAHASQSDSLYHAALTRWCGGAEDSLTVSILNR